MYGIFAQVTTKINDVTLNSQTVINNCGLIDFGTNSNNTLSFYFKFTKPSAQAIGNSNLKILLKYDSSSYGSEKGNVIVLSGSWSNNTEYIGTISCNISESEIKTTGSSIVLEFVTDSGVKSRSCEYPLNKALPPRFTFYPLSLSLACGDTSSKTFTIIPENIPSGASVTYLESYSNWSLISSTTTTRTLQPSSGTFLPSTVWVTPYINGVPYPSMTCAVSRSSFSSLATLAGNTIICPSENDVYTISGLGAGNTVSWSSSNIAVATVSGGTQSQVTVNGLTNGNVDLIATITNSCGQPVTKTKTINVGAPVLS